jgi:hypothetical protein
MTGAGGPLFTLGFSGVGAIASVVGVGYCVTAIRFERGWVAVPLFVTCFPGIASGGAMLDGANPGVAAAFQGVGSGFGVVENPRTCRVLTLVLCQPIEECRLSTYTGLVGGNFSVARISVLLRRASVRYTFPFAGTRTKKKRRSRRMQDRVGSTIPSEKEIDALIKDINDVEARVKKFTVLLTKEERGATTKFRRGGELIVGTLAVLAEEHGIKLPKISGEGMKADLLLAQRVRPLAVAVEGLRQRLDDTVLEAQSECWWAATAFYTALSRMVDADPRLEAALGPVVEFFAIGRRKVKAEGDK